MSKTLAIISILLFPAVAYSTELHVVKGPLQSGKIYVECSFDAVSEKCFLDTGAFFSAVKFTDATAAYQRVGSIYFGGAAGTRKEIDAIEVENVMVGISSLLGERIGRFNKDDSTAESIVGSNFFASKAFSFEFEETPSLSFGSAVATEDGLEVHKEKVFSIPLKLGASTMRGVWDTGAGLSVINQDFVDSYPDEFVFLGDVPGNDLTGSSVPLKLYRLKMMSIGNLEFVDTNLLGMNFDLIHKHLGKNLDFIIGFNTIVRANWAMDLKNRKWSVAPLEAGRNVGLGLQGPDHDATKGLEHISLYGRNF